MKIGIMGGTYSPPHIGHLHCANVFADEMKLDKLLIIPAKVSPFKVNREITASEKDRLEMARLCFSCVNAGNCDVEVSDIEIKKEGTSYTIETICELEMLYPDSELILFVGSDMFFSLERWLSAKNIFAKCRIYTRCRNYDEREKMLETKKKYENLYSASIIISDDKEIIVSSTGIRNALSSKNDEIARNLLTDKVLEYIIKNRLYYGENHEN